MTTPQGSDNLDPNAAGSPTPGQGGTPSPDGGKPGAQDGQPDKGHMVPIHALHEERQKRQELQSQVEALTEQVAAMRQSTVVNPVGPAGTYQQPQQDFRKQIDELWETDPRRAMQAELQMALTWYDGVTASVNQQMTDLVKKHPDAVSMRPEIENYLRTLPAQERARPGVADLAYYVVRGQKSEDIWKQREAEIVEKIRRGESVQGFNAGAMPSSSIPKPDKPLTEEQLKVAAAMGITPEDYKKNMR